MHGYFKTMIKKAYFGEFITAEGTRNGCSFIYFNRNQAKKKMLKIARGNCLEGSTCDYTVKDDFGQVFVHGKVSKRNGKYSYSII